MYVHAFVAIFSSKHGLDCLLCMQHIQAIGFRLQFEIVIKCRIIKELSFNYYAVIEEGRNRLTTEKFQNINFTVPAFKYDNE